MSEHDATCPLCGAEQDRPAALNYRANRALPRRDDARGPDREVSTRPYCPVHDSHACECPQDIPG